MIERLKEVRHALGMTQIEFSEALGFSRSYMSQVEAHLYGEELSKRIIAMLSNMYNVNEHWLRTGEGAMFDPLTNEEEIAKFFGELIKDDTSFKYRFVNALAKLDKDDWKTLEKFIDNMALESAKKSLNWLFLFWRIHIGNNNFISLHIRFNFSTSNFSR